MQQIDDRIADTGVKSVEKVEVSVAVAPGESVKSLRILGFCIPQLPRLDCEIKASVTAQYAGLKGGLKVQLEGAAADYLSVEQLLLNLAEKSCDLSGELTLLLTPTQPITHDDSDWRQLREVLTSNNPGKIGIEVTLWADGLAGRPAQARLMAVPTARERRFILRLHPNGTGDDWGFSLGETTGDYNEPVATVPATRAGRYRKAVVDAVTASGYAAAAVSSSRRRPFNLTCEPGVRLALATLALRTGPQTPPPPRHHRGHRRHERRGNPLLVRPRQRPHRVESTARLAHPAGRVTRNAVASRVGVAGRRLVVALGGDPGTSPTRIRSR